MGLLDGIDLTEKVRKTCNPCTESDCARCPTVLADNDVIESDFDCACFAQSPDSHEEAFVVRQGELDYKSETRNQIMADNFGRLDWDSEGRQAWTSVEHLF